MYIVVSSQSLQICEYTQIYTNMKPFVTTVMLIRERLLCIERPVETALLASLAGIKCVYGNQWHCRLKDNADKLSTVLQGSCFIYFTTAQAMIARCMLSSCVCPSQVRVVQRWLDLGSHKQCHTMAQGLVFWCQKSRRHSNEISLNGGAK